METITILVYRRDVYDEVAKATDYTGSKLIDVDAGARDRILAGDDDLAGLSRFWDESVSACNENFKELLQEWFCGYPALTLAAPSANAAPAGGASITTGDNGYCYSATLEVSKSFDKTLSASIQSTIRSYFIASIIGQWFKFANKNEASDYLAQATEMIEAAERMLYSRKRPTIPKD